MFTMDTAFTVTNQNIQINTKHVYHKEDVRITIKSDLKMSIEASDQWVPERDWHDE